MDHAAVQRWVVEYSPKLMEQARKVMKTSADSWRMDETYIKVKGQWVYLYRVVDKFGNTIDFMLSRKRDKPAATRFFTQAIGHAGIPKKVAIDKSGANMAGIELHHIIRKGQLDLEEATPFEQFYALAG